MRSPERHRALGLLVASMAMLAMLAGPAAATSGAVPSERPRLAFVIGNADYASVPALKNARNDAELVASVLRRLRFDVVEGYDLDLQAMTDVFVRNRDRIEAAESVTVYYAGHGFQIDGQNYLLPVDAALTSADAIGQQTIQLSAIIRQLQAADRPTLIFLDACRDNPLPPAMQLTDRADGLAQIEAGVNTFIAFATQPGNVSNDGFGDNSPFASALTKHLETPGLSISDLVIAVRNETRALTLERQSPWDQSSLLSQFYFTERQQLDQSKLLAALDAIRANEALATALAQDLDENHSYQAAVFRTAHRAVAVLGSPGAVPTELTALVAQPAPLVLGASLDDPAQTIELASASPSRSLDGAGDTPPELAPALSFAPVTAGPARPAPDRRRLASQMQTELQRLGCYRMRVDGAWGPGSRRAFERYLRLTGQSAGSLDPTQEWLGRVAMHSGRLCRAPVKVAKPVVATPVRALPARQVVQTRNTQPPKTIKRRAAPGQTKAAKAERRQQRRDALPPDIGMGVGIGM